MDRKYEADVNETKNNAFMLRLVPFEFWGEHGGGREKAEVTAKCSRWGLRHFARDIHLQPPLGKSPVPSPSTSP
jgi:hypothetical protein